MSRIKVHALCQRPLSECDCPPDDDDLGPEDDSEDAA